MYFRNMFIQRKTIKFSLLLSVLLFWKMTTHQISMLTDAIISNMDRQQQQQQPEKEEEPRQKMPRKKKEEKRVDCFQWLPAEVLQMMVIWPFSWQNNLERCASEFMFFINAYN